MNDIKVDIPNRRLEAFLDLLDIPSSYYDLARNRYKSLARWLDRDNSSVKNLGPSVYPQGSFRLGTVNRPLLGNDEYDLDLVVELKLLTKERLSQAELKKLVGHEIKAYANAKGVQSPVEEKKRCWRLEYADVLHFHMDILPALPDDQDFKERLIALGVPEDQATYAIAITDTRHPKFIEICDDWPRSNPKGFAKWFESRMEAVAQHRLRALVGKQEYASIDEIPTYRWKTPLQRAIQILKRHRDVMFKDKPRLKPISMIITTLAARAYEGEGGPYEALVKIVDTMPRFVSEAEPRVSNPVNPAEDFADKWKSDVRLEDNFWKWHTQVKADVAKLGEYLDTGAITELAANKFGLVLSETELRELSDNDGGSEGRAVITVPILKERAPLKPWRRDG